MLNDVTQAQLTAATTPLERASEPRGTRTATIPSAGSRPLQERDKAPERNVERARKDQRGETQAVEFRREETSLYRLYQSTRETVETSRREKIEELRQAFKNGTYRPNLVNVAERLLSSGELGRF